MRREVTTHPAYKHDSNVSQEIAYDVLSVRLHAGVCGASDDNDRSDAVFQCVPLSVLIWWWLPEMSTHRSRRAVPRAAGSTNPAVACRVCARPMARLVSLVFPVFTPRV